MCVIFCSFIHLSFPFLFFHRSQKKNFCPVFSICLAINEKQKQRFNSNNVLVILMVFFVFHFFSIGQVHHHYSVTKRCVDIDLFFHRCWTSLLSIIDNRQQLKIYPGLHQEKLISNFQILISKEKKFFI